MLAYGVLEDDDLPAVGVGGVCCANKPFVFRDSQRRKLKFKLFDSRRLSPRKSQSTCHKHVYQNKPYLNISLVKPEPEAH